MTKADPAGEPSMEDILASIRKIIAEEPPGSRPAPEPRAAIAAAPQPFRPFARESEPQAPLAPEPYLRPNGRTEPFQPFPAASIPDFAPGVRSELEFAPEQKIAPAPARQAASPQIPSVDDQLSDLLGAAPQPEPAAAAPAAHSVSASPGFIARMTSAPVAPVALQQLPEPEQVQSHSLPESPPEAAVAAPADPRPGFTVSRAGYVPGAEPDVPVRDPYNFDLGPSPFATKNQLAEPVLPAAENLSFEAARKTTAADLGAFVPVRNLDSGHVPIQSPAPLAREVSTPPIERAVQPAAAPVEAVAVETIAAAPVVEAAPAVTALPEAEPALATAHAPVMTLETLLPPVSAQAAGIRVVSEAQSIVAPPAAEIAVEPVPVRHEAPAASAPEVPVTAVAIFETNPEVASETHGPAEAAVETFPVEAQSAEATRTMEDTVAELLRPMLKSWLSENMPKIVERALRKELAERHLIEHKTAAE